jgi:hypothetical protein
MDRSSAILPTQVKVVGTFHGAVHLESQQISNSGRYGGVCLLLLSAARISFKTMSRL